MSKYDDKFKTFHSTPAKTCLCDKKFFRQYFFVSKALYRIRFDVVRFVRSLTHKFHFMSY